MNKNYSTTVDENLVLRGRSSSYKPKLEILEICKVYIN